MAVTVKAPPMDEAAAAEEEEDEEDEDGPRKPGPRTLASLETDSSASR